MDTSPEVGTGPTTAAGRAPSHAPAEVATGRLSDVATAGREVVLQLCGEILLGEIPGRQPTIVRAGASVGLQLLDLLLNPDHVLRATEELILRNTLVLGRRVRLDISLDQLSRQQEEGAAQLTALVSQRVDLEHRGRLAGRSDAADTADTMTSNVDGQDLAAADSERLWIPLDTFPRPVAVAVTVTGTDGSPLPRPPQQEVHQALEAALYHILRESLRAHPDFDAEAEDRKPVNVLMRHDDRARWLLQGSLLSVCQFGPGTSRYQKRIEEVASRLTGPGADKPSDDEMFALLDALTDGRTALPSPRRTALQVVRDAVAHDEPFLELLSLVHRHYFVVAALDRGVRDHSVQFDLPESETLDDSVARNPFQRSRRTVDPREHNYTVHVQVPVPYNVRQYNLQVRTAAETAESSYNEVSLIGAIHYDDHPGRSALDALSTCAEELMASLTLSGEEAGGDGADDDAQSPTPAQAMRVGFIASRAVEAVDRLEAIVEAQRHAADELEARWGRASTWTVKQSASKVRAVTTKAGSHLKAARQELDAMRSGLAGAGDVRKQVEATIRALGAAIQAMEHPLLATQLVSNELAGQETARIRIDRSMLTSPSAPRPRHIDVWATVTDEARPYAYSAIGPPVGLALFVYLTGYLLFDSLIWPAYVSNLSSVTSPVGEADAIVAVLLLAPALAATQLTVPDRWSVAGWLRRPARLFVLAAIAMLGGTAMVVATQVGEPTGQTQSHPHLVLWTFRGILAFFLGWSGWAAIAARLRRRYSWRPKGLRSLFGIEPSDAQEARSSPGLLSRLNRFFHYDNKAPDADFELTMPTRSFPSHPGDS